jgi:hypothetical protein
MNTNYVDSTAVARILHSYIVQVFLVSLLGYKSFTMKLAAVVGIVTVGGAVAHQHDYSYSYEYMGYNATNNSVSRLYRLDYVDYLFSHGMELVIGANGTTLTSFSLLLIYSSAERLGALWKESLGMCLCSFKHPRLQIERTAWFTSRYWQRRPDLDLRGWIAQDSATSLFLGFYLRTLFGSKRICGAVAPS